MRDGTREKVEAYYSTRAGHPLSSIGPGEVKVVGSSERHVGPGGCMLALGQVGAPDDADYFLKDGAAFACWVDGNPVAFAGTHPVGEFSDRVGNVMVGTLAEHRGRGHGKAVVSATTGKLLRQGLVGVFGTLTSNIPSIRAARAVGYHPFATVFAARFT